MKRWVVISIAAVCLILVIFIIIQVRSNKVRKTDMNPAKATDVRDAADAKEDTVPDIPVLLYHRIMTVATNQATDTSVEDFTKTMAYLVDQGYTTLTADQYVAIMEGTAIEIPEKPIILTFDDATPDFIKNTLPILNKYQMNAVVFVVTGWIGGNYSMSLDELKDLAANYSNISLQNHSANHTQNLWSGINEADASAELAKANAFLKDITGKDPIFFAYPYGQYNAEVQLAAAANGIKYSFIVGYPNKGAQAMGRYYIQMDTELKLIALWIGGPKPEVDGATVTETAPKEGGTVAIKDVYKNDFLIGTAVLPDDFMSNRLNLIKTHYNVVTPGNAMKPESTQPKKGQFTFTTADAIVKYATEAGLKIHGHVLVWHEQSPAWMNMISLSREEALDNMKTHIQTVMEHYGNGVISWDVVNEAMNDNPGNPTDWKSNLRQTPWYKVIGDDYVEQAFLIAREVLDAHPDWQIQLYYNDYNLDNQNKAQAVYSMVEEMNKRYAKTHPGKRLIDGVGMQGHYNQNTSPENVRLSLEKFISLDVEVSITELDIQAGSDGKLSEASAYAQGYLYAQMMTLFREHAKNIERVTFWGIDDGTSWRAASSPLLFDKELKAKPAYAGVIDPESFMNVYQPAKKDSKQGTAHYATPVIDGEIDDVWSQTEEIVVDQFQMAWQGATGVARALWDDENLYVLIQVKDVQLDKTSENVWEQDSVEIFLDQKNNKSSFYEEDDGQYRVNFDNEGSYNPDSIAEGFESATKISGTNYTVEVKIPLTKITPKNNLQLGFDVQINDGKNGSRQSVSAWNDLSGAGYMDTSVYGSLTLVGK